LAGPFLWEPTFPKQDPRGLRLVPKFAIFSMAPFADRIEHQVWLKEIDSMHEYTQDGLRVGVF
jgi:hypothetical protein